MRVSERKKSAMTGSAFWLRIPIGKLHNDRYIPLHPQLKEMLDQRVWYSWQAPISYRVIGVAGCFLGIWVVFSLGNSADVFLLLRARDLGLSATGVVFAYALYNTLYSGLSWPLGHLSDRIGRRRLLAAGLVVFAAVYTGFGFARGTAALWPLFALYGCYMAATDGVARALVADLSPAGLRASRAAGR